MGENKEIEEAKSDTVLSHSHVNLSQNLIAENTKIEELNRYTVNPLQNLMGENKEIEEAKPYTVIPLSHVNPSQNLVAENTEIEEVNRYTVNPHFLIHPTLKQSESNEQVEQENSSSVNPYFLIDHTQTVTGVSKSVKMKNPSTLDSYFLIDPFFLNNTTENLVKRNEIDGGCCGWVKGYTSFEDPPSLATSSQIHSSERLLCSDSKKKKKRKRKRKNQNLTEEVVEVYKYEHDPTGYPQFLIDSLDNCDSESLLRDERKKKRKRKKRNRKEDQPCIKLSLERDKELAIRQIVDSIGTLLKKPLQTHIPERSGKRSRSRSRSQSPKNRPKKEVMSLQDKYSHMEESQFKRLFMHSITGSMTANVDNALLMPSRLSRDPELDKELLEDLELKRQSEQYQEMLSFRRKLPSWSRQEELLQLIRDNQIMVVSGETGCGKTTQVAQFILDDAIERGVGSTCHIVCTQPRRISAISVAERVAAERNETVGIGGGGVGYTIRLESHAPRDQGSILFCTTGILLRMLGTDPALTRVSHLILDEIHERDTISDFAITILRDIIPKRPDLRLILMSATLNADHFSKYYDNCAMINIPGFTFPVKEYYLEDVLQMTKYLPRLGRSGKQGRWKSYQKKLKAGEKEELMQFRGMVHPFLRELTASKQYSPDVINHLYDPESEEISLELIAELIKHIDRAEGEGAILVFLPGWDKISSLNKMLTQQGLTERTGYRVIPLHSMLSTVSQRTVFERPPTGVRKIVIATNIAETSITIDDVVFVIDCGKIKMKNFDLALNITTLKEEWVSLANARQRRGRAGRVRDGVCYHLFTRAREQLLESYPVPEMVRTRLEEVILQAKMLQLGSIKPFLSRVLNPPEPKAIDLSLKLLNDLNALDDDEHLTPLGYHLAQLPMDPQTGKMILMAALFGVIDPVFSVAASLSFKDAFVVPVEAEFEFFKKKKELALGTKSDHLVLAEALTRWEAEAENKTNGGWQFAREYYLSTSTLSLLKDMKKQFAQHLNDMSFLSTSNYRDRQSNHNSHNIGLIKAIICAGLYPNVAIIKNVKKIRTGGVRQRIITPEDGSVNLHRRSINYDEPYFEGRFLVYHLKMKTTKVYLYDTTMVFALALIFFGHDFDLCREEGMVVIELSPKIRFTCPASTALLIKELRQRLDELLEYKVAHPGVTNWDQRSDEGKLLRAIAELISYEDEKLTIVEDSDDGDYDEEYDDLADDRPVWGVGRGRGGGGGSGRAENWREGRHSHHQAGPSHVTPFPRF